VADALKIATAEKFDLYILDYHLPDATGLDLCLKLRTFDTKTPILFATSTSSITEAKVISSGAQGLISMGGISFVRDLQARVSRLTRSH
jgi:DNA-binding response OmpR family regulator